MCECLPGARTPARLHTSLDHGQLSVTSSVRGPVQPTSPMLGEEEMPAMPQGYLLKDMQQMVHIIQQMVMGTSSDLQDLLQFVFVIPAPLP